VPVEPARPKELIRLRRPFLGRDAIRQGQLTPDQLRSGAWRRLLRGVYCVSTVPITHDLMIDAASLVIPKGAVVTGRSAAHFWGADLAGPDDPVEVLIPRGTRFGPFTGLIVRTGDVPADELREVINIPLTDPLRTAWEIARSLDLVTGMPWLDALARRHELRREALVAYAHRRHGEYGWRRALRALDLVEPKAESPPESSLRIQLVLGGLPRPVVQHRVLHQGRFVARVDLAWPARRLAVEYDGEWHGEPGRLPLDRQRLRALRRAGWEVYPVTRFDLREPDRLVAEVSEVLIRLSSEIR
jgi:very-short-patch-repair endonuclease